MINGKPRTAERGTHGEHMKRLFLSLVLMLTAAMAFALPRPSQIEDALANQRYDEARSMINEVLREHPESARAHLLNSFVLVHADRNRVAAAAELETARGLDKKGDVKTSSLFGRTVAEIDAVPPPVKQRPAAKVEKSGSGAQIIVILLIVFGVAAVLVYFLTRYTRSPAAYIPPPSFGYPSGVSSNPIFPGSGGMQPLLQPATHTVIYPPSASAQQPMGPLGTAASVAGGVVAGNAISDLIRGHSSGRDDEWSESRRKRESPSDSAPYQSSPVSNESERSSFSSGSSSSWDSSSSSSSSSSYSDWGGSSDSSSSSGSDW